MKITDAPHAVRVLKYLVRQMHKSIKDKIKRWHIRDIFDVALIEGVEAVLKEYKRMIENNTMGQVCAGYILIELAQAYAPRMEEAGMKVPK